VVVARATLGNPIVRNTYVVAAAGLALLNEADGSSSELRVERVKITETSTYLQYTLDSDQSYACVSQPDGIIQVFWASNGLLDITDKTMRHLAYDSRTRSAAQQLSSWERTADASGVAFGYAFETSPGSAGAWVSGSTERLRIRE